MKLLCDLHIHTCLSPCGDLDASPNAVVRKAIEAGLDVIAVCDHNSALNCRTAVTAGACEGIAVIAGIEVATIEEAHVLALFPELEDAEEFSRRLYELLPSGTPGRFASSHIDQVYVDTEDVILGEVDKLLVSGADISIEDVLEYVHGKNGLVIPSHIDRPSFSIPSQLGFFPDLGFDAVEIALAANMGMISGLPRTYPVIASSDAHHPDYVGSKYTEVEAESKDFHAIAEAIKAGRTRLYFP